MSTTVYDRQVEEACDRLTESILGLHADDTAKQLTRRVAASHLPSVSDDNPLSKIERSIPNKNTKQKVVRLHRELQQVSGNDNDQLPQQILGVLLGLKGGGDAATARKQPQVHTDSLLDYKRNEQRHNDNHRMPDDAVSQAFQEAMELEERLVLRDCLYALQAMSSSRIIFLQQDYHDTNDGAYQEDIEIRTPALTETKLPPHMLARSRLGSGAQDALRICGQAGWLYQRVQNYISSVQDEQQIQIGAIPRALVEALQQEMQDYRTLLAHLEEQQPASLRQILAHIRIPVARLKTLALVVDGVRALEGAKLLTGLWRHARHGDQRHVQVIQRLLQAASRPWFQMLFFWTTQGVLQDPYHEFFVQRQPQRRDETSSSMSRMRNLWRDEYILCHDRIPEGIIDPSVIQPAYTLGKTINYLRQGLHDDDWSFERNGGEVPDPSRMGYYYSFSEHQNRSSLVASVERKALQVHSHVLSSLQKEHHMVEHLYALKQFLLLGQGDFFSTLVDSLQTEYEGSQGIVGIYRHTLSALVEGSIRSTNAGDFPPNILERVHVELLIAKDDDAQYMFAHSSQSAKDKRSVWDIFSLEYSVPEPLQAIVYSDMMQQYQAMFCFLFRIKKIDHFLNYTWRQGAALQHAVQRAAQYNGINTKTHEGYAQATILLRQIAMTRQCMTHFVSNLKSFLLFEVLEGGWQLLRLAIEEAETLQDVIVAHDEYMRGIVSKSLIHRHNNEGDLGSLVSHLLSLVDSFCLYQERLFGESLEAAERAAAKRREAEDRLKAGEWGFKSEDEIADEDNFFGLADQSSLETADALGMEFNTTIADFLEALDTDLHGGSVIHNDENLSTPFVAELASRTGLDEDGKDERDDLDALRFLCFQLNHNKFYTVQTTL